MIDIRKSPIFLNKMMYPSESNTIIFACYFLSRITIYNKTLYLEKEEDSKKKEDEGEEEGKGEKKYAIND